MQQQQQIWNAAQQPGWGIQPPMVKFSCHKNFIFRLSLHLNTFMYSQTTLTCLLHLSIGVLIQEEHQIH